MASEYKEERFRAKLDNAMKKVKTILDNNRFPKCADDVEHSYQDKFSLAEMITNSALLSLIETCSHLGWTQEHVKTMKEWSIERSVTLRFQSEHRCTFINSKERKVESSTQHVTKIRGLFSATEKTVTTVTDYFWKFESKISILAFPGNDPSKSIEFLSRKGNCELVITNSDVPPYPEFKIFDPLDVNITYLLSRLSDSLEIEFSIDRNNSSCHTPRRNLEILDASKFFKSFEKWCNSVSIYLVNILFPIQPHQSLEIGSTKNIDDIFVPIIPLMENVEKDDDNIIKGGLVSIKSLSSKSDNNENPNVILKSMDIQLFIEEQSRGLLEKLNEMDKTFPENKELLTNIEAKIIVIMEYSRNIYFHFIDGIDFIENMLRQQLITAIGKEVQPSDFDEYMLYHYRKLFKEEFEPIPFCISVRRPEHYPEGIVSIEMENSESRNECIKAIVRKYDEPKIMSFPINASTNIKFGGERYVHAWMNFQFSNSLNSNLKIIARARQFSSFILLLGTVTSATEFTPKEAIIIENKDDILIPLLTEVIPTPKAFKKAVESLSEEQRAFAKAFRSMQLESTLFALCVIQIKPQLEKVLCLPEDSLTKEIKLTQDILNLFLEYQISTDLLCYEPEDGIHHNNQQKINIVKNNVSELLKVIEKAKEDTLKKEKQSAIISNPSKGGLLAQIQLGTSLKAVPQRQTYQATACSMDTGSLTSALLCRRSSALDEEEDDDDSDDWDDGFNFNGGGGGGGGPVSLPEQTVKEEEMEEELDIYEDAEPVMEIKDEKEEGNKEEKEEKEEKEKEYDLQAQNKDSSTDFTKIPGILNKNFGKLDKDDALHSTILKTEGNWKKEYKKSLLSEMETMSLDNEGKEKERNKAFDLLDSISRSGGLVIDAASFHVVLATTHCFDRSLINTVVQDNVNPIEKAERSSLIVASTIHEDSAGNLIREDCISRVSKTCDDLF